ncbi:MAG: 4Fe-4S binding protein [Desulfobacterales bacterium]|jgi:Fe-S-cluster-containing hydrogenase component 2|nr:4Fe-4S binding protein [Desulfobacterales bacterium]
MKVKRKIIEIDEEKCDGCGLCVPACAEGSLRVVNGKARVISENLCDGLGACLGECPRGALRIVERVAEEFDEEAVEKHLADADVAPASCPSAGIRMFAPADACAEANRPTDLNHFSDSALSHWPVQIRLVPPRAPFLKNADLLVLADCAAVAAANLHGEFLRGRVVMMGCPKFDDVEDYVARFTEIFSTANLRRITILYMEVPCCGGLPRIIEKALKDSGRDIPVETVRLACNGNRLAPAA